MEKTVADRVRELIVDYQPEGKQQSTNECTLIGNIGFDSLDIVELVMAFEEEFRIEIPDADLPDNPELITVGSMIQLVEKKIATRMGVVKVCDQ